MHTLRYSQGVMTIPVADGATGVGRESKTVGISGDDKY
jgi:hypothetical protein